MRRSLASALAILSGTRNRTKKVEAQGEIAPPLMRAANLVMIKVGLMLAAFFVALAICITFYYPTIVFWLFF